MKCGMHILDDRGGLSARASGLIGRTGWREPPGQSRIATDFPRVRDHAGRTGNTRAGGHAPNRGTPASPSATCTVLVRV